MPEYVKRTGAYTKAEVQHWLEELRDGRLQLNEDNMGMAGSALLLLDMDVPEPLEPGHLTEHFTLNEMCVTGTGLDNTPNPTEISNLQRTAEVLEEIRVALGDNPITVTSAFRSEEVNNAVGGVPNSAHRLGLAADFVCPGYGTPREIAHTLQPLMRVLDLDQLIYEDKGGAQWVHVGLSAGAPRYMALTITDAGTVSGIA